MVRLRPKSRADGNRRGRRSRRQLSSNMALTVCVRSILSSVTTLIWVPSRITCAATDPTTDTASSNSSSEA